MIKTVNIEKATNSPRGLKAQMKYADKIGAKFTVVLGDNEIETGKVKLKDMSSGSETEIKLDEICEELGEAIRKKIFEQIAETEGLF